MKKAVAVTVTSLLLTVSLFAISANAVVNTPEYIQERFAVYGYTPRLSDITYWGKTKRNGFGTLEENLQRRFSQKRFMEVIERDTVLPPLFDTIGASIPRRPTEFKTSLAEQKTEGHSNTTLKVTSITTKDGNTLDPVILGDFIVLSINSGKSNAEVVACTGLTTGTKTFTGCTFGYRFDNPTATQSGNIEAHAPGEPVIISNTDTYLATQYPTIDGDNTFLGINRYASTTASTTVYLKSQNNKYPGFIVFGPPTATFPWLGVYGEDTTTTMKVLFSNNGTDVIDLANIVNGGLTGGSGTSISGSQINVNLSATSSPGLNFTGASGEQIKVFASSTGGIVVDGNGVAFDEADSQENLTGNWNFQGRATVTTDFIVGSNYANASGTAFVRLTDGSVVNGLHSHRPVLGDGMASSTGSVTYTHNLGVTPSLLTINGTAIFDINGTVFESWSHTGYATSTASERSVATYTRSATSAYGNLEDATSTSSIVSLSTGGGNLLVVGDLTTLNSTQFTINFTTFHNGMSPYRFIWKVDP